MQTSEKLHRQKHEKELNSRIDDTIFELKRVKNEIKILCDDLKSLNNTFTAFQKEVNNKFKEIFAYTKRLDEAYLNGLSDYDMKDGIYKPSQNDFESKISGDSFFTLDTNSEYDKL